MVNIIVLVKKRKNELLLLPVPGSMPKNQNNFFELCQKYKFRYEVVAYSSQKFDCIKTVKKQM